MALADNPSTFALVPLPILEKGGERAAVEMSMTGNLLLVTEASADLMNGPVLLRRIHIPQVL